MSAVESSGGTPPRRPGFFGALGVRHRRGFATAVTLTLMILVALAGEALMSSFATDARRMRDEIVEAQLRQLLIAGATQARAISERGPIPPEPMAIALPDELAKEGAKAGLRFIRAKDAISVEIEAVCGSHHMHETLPLPGQT
jgi:hypothetical protein